MPTKFSHRFGYHPISGKVVYEEASIELRNRFLNLLCRLIDEDVLPGGQVLASHILDEQGKVSLQSVTGQYYHEPERLIELFGSAEWYEFFDIVQHLTAIARDPEPYEKSVNALLEKESVGWRLDNGHLIRATSPYIDQKIEDALGLLNRLFVGPSTQFRKAIEFFSGRPKPDHENAIKEAVGALEATARICTGNTKATLGEAVKTLVEKGIIPKPLDQAFHSVYGFASNAPGVRKGMHEPSKLGPLEAELMIGVCATCIVFLARSHEVDQKSERPL